MCTWAWILAWGLCAALPARADQTLADVAQDIQSKMVKIFGAGGPRGLESYQSGMLISEAGHILTMWSYVLDTDQLTVTLHDGRSFLAEFSGLDPRWEIAILKIDETGLPHFRLDDAVDAPIGSRVLAVSNLFGIASGNEPLSVMQGWIAAHAELNVRRGTYNYSLGSPVFVLDMVTSNPGAAGGALLTWRGQPVGLLGKEVRQSDSDAWFNHALPLVSLAPIVRDLLEGKGPRSGPLGASSRAVHPMTLELLGIRMVPDVLEVTPPFVDAIEAGSPADAAGVKPDDLVIEIGGVMVRSCRELLDRLSAAEQDMPLSWTLLRGQELIQATIDVAQGERVEP